jgi:hypothetical protein
LSLDLVPPEVKKAKSVRQQKTEPEEPEPEVDLLGQLSVMLDAEYMLRPSRQAITDIEHGTGKSLSQLAVQAGSLTLSVAELGFAVAEMMKAYAVDNREAAPSYRNAKAERCADLIYENGPVDVSRRLAVIFVGALTGGYTAAGEPKAAGMKTKTEQTPTAD